MEQMEEDAMTKLTKKREGTCGLRCEGGRGARGEERGARGEGRCRRKATESKESARSRRVQ
jgi:hypothetical protein